MHRTKKRSLLVVPPALTALFLISLTVISAGVYIFWSSQTLEHSVTVSGGDFLVIDPKFDGYSARIEPTTLVIQKDPTDGGGSLTFESCIAVAVDDHNLINPLLLSININGPEGMLITVDGYWQVFWENSFSEVITDVYSYDSLVVNLNGATANINSISVDDVNEKMLYDSTAIPYNTPHGLSDSCALLLAFTFEAYGAELDWGVKDFEIVIVFSTMQ